MHSVIKIIVIKVALVLQGTLNNIIPQAQMGSESASRAIDSEPIRAREIIDCFSKIQVVGQKYRDKTTLAS